MYLKKIQIVVTVQFCKQGYANSQKLLLFDYGWPKWIMAYCLLNDVVDQYTLCRKPSNFTCALSHLR